MAEVKLFIYNDSKIKGEGITLSREGNYIHQKVTEISDETKPDTNSDGKIRTVKNSIVSYEIPLSMTKLRYVKRVYEPCKIHAELQMGMSITKKEIDETKTTPIDKDGKDGETTTKQDVKSTIDTPLTADTIIDFFKGAKVEMEIDGNKVAENYIVFEVRSIYKTVSASTSLFLNLSIYSADKSMDLDKYSRAYTAKMLYTDILAEESKNFSSVSVANHMQLLKYKAALMDSSDSTKEKCSWTGREELRIPYIVQYNESFYQFMVRAANRYGEFLYFEDGKLNLGMQPSETNYFKKVENDSVVIDWATEPNAVQTRYYQSALSGAISVNDRAYNYISHTQNEDGSQLYADSASNRYNPDTVAFDEWTKQELEKGEYLEYKEILGEEMRASIPEAIFKALEASTLSEVLVNLIKGFTMKLIEVSRQNRDYNNVLDKANYQDKDKNYLISDDQKKDDDYTQFASLGGSSPLAINFSKLFDKGGINNFYDLFYSLVRKKEKEVGEQAVWLDFGTNYKPIKLGDKLHIDKKDYVVISVEGYYEPAEKTDGTEGSEKKGKEHLLVSAIPVMSLDGTTSVALDSVPDEYDNWTNTLPFPPAQPDVIFREARPQVAFVAATLDPENLGRIRVRYPWQDEKGDASPWIRVTLPLATDGGGVNFTPNVGDEVMVGYEHGNIDRPYAMGYLVAPFVNKRWSNALPLDQYGSSHGIKTKTGHHLTFEDGFALAPMFFESVGCLSFLRSIWPVGATGPWPFGNELTADFGGGFELGDRYGFYKISGSTENRAITIESPIGTVEMSAFQGITITAPNGDINISGKNVNISASNRLSLSSGENIKNKLWYQKKWNESKGKALGNAVLGDLQGGLDSLKEIATNITDMSLLRCVIELLFRPVNGTLQIKSYTFVTIEAGEGKVEVPPKNLRKIKYPTLTDDFITIKLIKYNIDPLIDTIHQKYDKLLSASEAFMKISGANGINKNQSAIKYTTVISCDTVLDDSKFTWEDGTGNNLKDEIVEELGEKPEKKDFDGFDKNFKYFNAIEEWRNKKNAHDSAIKRNNRRKKDRTRIVEISQALSDAAKELADAAKKWTDMDDKDFLTYGYNKENKISEIVKMIKAEDLLFYTGIKSLNEMKSFGYDEKIGKPNSDAWLQQKKALPRYISYLYIKNVDGIDYDKNVIFGKVDVVDNDNWMRFVRSLKQKEGFGDSIKDWAKEELNPFAGFIDDQKQWAYGFKGQILMSDQSDKTASFDSSLNLTSHDNQEEECVELITDLLKTM